MRDAETMKMGRLTRRPEFLRVASARQKAAAPGLVLQARPRGDDDPVVRVGFTASKKVGNAVARNRARRRLREAVRTIIPALGRPGTDYVIIARAATVKRPFQALLSDLEGAVRRLGSADRKARSAAPERQSERVAP